MKIKSLVKNCKKKSKFRRHGTGLWTVAVVMDSLVMVEDSDHASLHQVGERYCAVGYEMIYNCHITSGLWSEIAIIESLITWFLILNNGGKIYKRNHHTTI